jgi:ADP-L-glycero-D-manno-heptose 6-epimerase
MIVITGASGFIGSNLAHRLAGEGKELLFVDLHHHERIQENLAGLDRFPFMDHVAFVQEFEAGLVNPEVVFHLGACSDTTETNWDYLRENNIEYSARLWRGCVRRGIPYIYASSAATYGDGSAGFDDRTPPEQLQPLNLYGKSKNEFDKWVLSRPASDAPPRWAGLKFFNVYGPREGHKGAMASVVWKARKQIEETGEVTLFRSSDPQIKDGEQKRDFVFVGDCVEHMLWLWREPHAGGIFNSGSGTARTFLDLANAVFAAMNRKPNIRFVDMPAQLTGRYQNFTQAVMTKLRAAGCSIPSTSLEDGVRQSIAQYA